MTKKSAKKNYFFNVSYQVLTLITPLIAAPYLARVLQPDGVGRISFAESIVSYFSLVAVMGIGIYGQREISYVQDSLEKRSEVFWNTKMMGFCTSGLVIIIYLVFTLSQKENASIYLILTLNLIANFFDITWFFQGMEDFAKTVTRNAIFKVIQVVCVFSFVKRKEDILIYVLNMGLTVALGNISLWAYLPRYITWIPLSKLRPFKDFKVMWSLFIPTIAMQIYTVLDKTMIGIITDNSYENGYYEQALKISKMLLSLVTALGTVMVPRIGYLFNKGYKEDIKRYMYRGYKFVWFLGIPLCFGVIMSSANFVPWFLGAGYDKVIPLLQILSLLILAIGINNVTGIQYLIPTKKQNIFTMTVIIGAVTNFCLNMVLIYFFKSIGAAIASVTAESVIAVVQLIIVRRELSPVQVLKEGIHYFIAGIIMVFVLIPITKFLTPSIFHSIVIALSGAIVYLGILLLEKDEFLISNIKMIWNKLLKR